MSVFLWVIIMAAGVHDHIISMVSTEMLEKISQIHPNFWMCFCLFSVK